MRPAAIARDRNAPPAFKNPQGLAPPNDLDAEMDLLGHCLSAANGVEAVPIWLRTEMFYSEQHRAIFEAIRATMEAGVEVHSWTVGAMLRDQGRLAQIGGLAYIARLMGERPSITQFVDRVAQRIREKWRLRELIQRSWETIGESYADGVVALDHCERAESRVRELTEDGTSSAATPIAEAVRENLDGLKSESASPKRYTKTGVGPIDERLVGLFDGEMTIVGARPGVGKTALTMQVADFVGRTTTAEGERLGAAVFSLEMPKRDLAMGLSAAHADLDYQRTRSGMLTSHEWGRYFDAANHVIESHLLIDHDKKMTARHIRAQARMAQREFKNKGVRLALVAIDYLQLVDCWALVGARAEERERVDAGAKFFSELAHDLKCPILCLSALNRPPPNRSRPRVEDLSGSSRIEAHANFVWLIHREEVSNLGSKNVGRAEIDVPKARGGTVGRIHASYRNGFFRSADDYRPTADDFRNAGDESWAR